MKAFSLLTSRRIFSCSLRRLLLCGLMIVSVSAFCLESEGAVPPDPDAPTIAIVQPKNVTAYEEAVKGFLDALRKRFSSRMNILVFDSADGLYKTLKSQKATTSDASEIDLILTVGTRSTADVALKIRDIPLLFSMVLEPARVLGARRDIVGASLNIPGEVQLKLITEVLPGARRVGVIYDPQYNADTVRQLKRAASQFRLTLNAFPVTSQKEIPRALELVGKQADVLLGIVDNTVYTSRTTEFIIRYTIKERLPFFGLSASYVKAGALCSLGFNNRDIGRQTAELAIQVLSGKAAVRLQTTVPERLEIAVNLRTANIIGVNIPQHIRRNAAIIYE